MVSVMYWPHYKVRICTTPTFTWQAIYIKLIVKTFLVESCRVLSISLVCSSIDIFIVGQIEFVYITFAWSLCILCHIRSVSNILVLWHQHTLHLLSFPALTRRTLCNDKDACVTDVLSNVMCYAVMFTWLSVQDETSESDI